MRLWKTRNQRPLQTSLAFDFLRFLVIVLVISLGAYLFIQLDVTQKLKDYQLADPDLKVTASQYLNNPKSGPETGKLLRSRGWLEILDGSKLIKEVIGNKQDQMISYSEEQLYKLLENDRSQDYYYSLSRYPGLVRQTGCC